MNHLTKLSLSIFFLLICVSYFSCSSPQKSFDKGNYEQAFSSALKNLNKGKSDRKDKTILNKAFEKLYNEKLTEAQSFLRSDVLEDWEEAHELHEEIIELYNDGSKYLSSDFDAGLEKVHNNQDQLGTDLAEGFHNLGQESMLAFNESGNKLAAQDAHYFYERTQYYDPNFTDIDEAIDKALLEGTILVLIEADAPFEFSYEWEIDREFDDIERQSSQYVDIKYNKLVSDPDCVLEINFGRLDRDTRQSTRTDRFTEEIEDGFETSIDTSGREIRVPRYRTIEGSVTTITEEIRYEWDMSVRPSGIREYCNFRQRIFSADERIQIERYELSGDRDAIPSRFREEDVSIDEDDIVEELIEDLYDEFRRYYF